MKQLTISLFSVDNSDEEVSAPSSQQENSSFPSRKAIITGIYKKLYVYLEEEITKIQNPVLEKKTPAKMTINVFVLIFLVILENSCMSSSKTS